MANDRVSTVVVGGQNIDLGTEMSVEEARSLVQELGVATNIGGAKAQMVNNSTVEFINEYGENGTK